MFLFFFLFYFFITIKEDSALEFLKNKGVDLLNVSRIAIKKRRCMLSEKKINFLFKKNAGVLKTIKFLTRKYSISFLKNNKCSCLTNTFVDKSKNLFMIHHTAIIKGKFFYSIKKKPHQQQQFLFLRPYIKRFFLTNRLWNPSVHYISKTMGKECNSINLSKREDFLGGISSDCKEKREKSENGFFMTSDEVRNSFINYFHKKDHTIIESSSVVPYNDQTLLFTNAGMNQFKSIFLGNVDKQSNFGKLKRAVDTQKCIRAGGKHNDLDDVGKDVYHHTFFEMLGNWSFGDYFKEESIFYAWDLLTNVFKINPDRLYVTYYGGDKDLPSCPEDVEAKTIWKKYLPENRILPFGLKDNFWEMAETGPCGPCTEIHYDRLGNRDASELVNKDDPSVLEIWNVVFMQYNKDENKNLNLLPSPCVDTGMGLERITSVLQNVYSNYDTDIFVPIFKQIKEIFPHLPEYSGKVNEEDVGKIDTAYRVISDHIRCVTIAICDGCLPSNEGRNYVIRRIIRRAVRFGKQAFNIEGNDLWFYKLVDSVCLTLGNTFKELKNEKKVNYIKNTIKQEEMLFNRTLEKGMEQFNKIIKKSTNNCFSGKDAFDLYTSFGFPIDLIEVMCEEKKFQLNVEEFNMLFKRHQLISDTNNFKITKMFDISVEKAHELKTKHNVAPTIDHDKYTWKNTDEVNDFKLGASVRVIYDGSNFLDTVEHSNEEIKYALILDRTNFYFENGGQIYDTGFIQNERMKYQVLNVQKVSDFVLHIGILLEGKICINDKIETVVDFERRTLIACNHTATHLLNFMVRKVLTECLDSNQKKDDTSSSDMKIGESEQNDCSIHCCEQKGSLVDDEKLRFDFSFFENLTTDQIEKIEQGINKLIQQELGVYVKNIDLAVSKKIKGIRAIFEENYANKVNVVSIEKDVDNILNNLDVNYTHMCSVELCGGTHIGNTKYIKRFIITSEESIGKGVYRITAVTNRKAIDVEKKFDDLHNKYQHLFQEEVNENMLPDVQSYKSLLNEDKFLPYLKKKNILANIDKVEKVIIEKMKSMQKELINKATNIGKVYFLEEKKNEVIDVKYFDEIKGNQKILEKIVQSYNKNNKNRSIFFIIADDMNAYCVFEVKNSLKDKNIQADVFMKEIMNSIEGNSGGSKSKAFGSTSKDKIIALQNLVDSKLKPFM